MKVIILFTGLFFLSSTIYAATIVGDYPICKTETDSQSFSKAIMFNDWDTMEKLVSDGNCTFTEPDTKATIMEKTLIPKVMVFRPYGVPLKGWTDGRNVKP